MNNDNQIHKYLEYLKEISKKIAQTNNFDSIFTKKSTKENIRKDFVVNAFKIDCNLELIEQISRPLEIKKNSGNYQKINKMLDIVDNNSTLKMFLGFYFSVCKLKGKTSKKIFSPWFFIECECKKDINDDIFITLQKKININTESIINIFNGENLNLDQPGRNDFVSLLVDKLFQEDGTIHLTDLAKQIQTNISTITLEDSNSTKKIEFEINDNLLDNITNSHDFFVKKTSEDSIYFSKNNLLFIGEEPNELSTYKSLEGFVKDINNQSITSDNVMFKLLQNSLAADEKSDLNKPKLLLNEEETNIFENITSKERHLIKFPMALSSSQLQAIKNCFENRVSYIQGPPGTGKSYTITALIIASILLNKKILVVAQKPVALEAIKEKLNEVLQLNNNTFFQMMPYILFDSDKKSNLKKDFENLILCLNDKNKYLTWKNEIFNEQKTIEDRLENYKIKHEIATKKIKNYLNEQELLFNKNKKFIPLRDELSQFNTFNFKVEKEFKLPESTKNNILDKIKKIQDFYDLNQSIKKYHIFYLTTLSKYIKNYSIYIDIFSLLKNGLLEKFFTTLIPANLIFNELSKEQKKAVQLEMIEQYKKDLTVSEEIKFLQAKYVTNLFLINFINNKDKLGIENLTNFKRLLYNRDPSKIKERLTKINFNNLIEMFPIWLSEIRNISEALPNEPEAFDLVIVDEASQVNLAEILPVFYKGKHICVVGDHNQLGLDSTGLNFTINNKFDQATWKKNKIVINDKLISYEEAENAKLTVSKSSILDLIRSEENYGTEIIQTLLNEHYRSLPALAKFNSKHFYENKINIMTDTPDKIAENCFNIIKVQGEKDNKVNTAEADKIVDLIKLIISSDFENLNKDVQLNSYCLFNNEFKGDIAVISYIRNQVNYIKEKINDEINKEDIDRLKIIVGTPEELQGQERSIVFFSMVADKDSRITGHFTKVERFNVAMSRAKYHNIFVYSDGANMPSIFNKYLLHFNYKNENNDSFTNESNLNNFDTLGWSFDENKIESEFERRLYLQLLNYKECYNTDIKIFNQVQVCGEKRLDFVLYNPINNKFIAVEADGFHHFDATNNYADWHIDRINTLKRAGWIIVNTAYTLWYNRGWLSIDTDKIYKDEIERIHSEFNNFLN